MKLKVLGRYQNEARQIDVHPGDEIEVKDELAIWLMADAPGCFEAPSGELPTAEEQRDQQPFDRAPDGTTLPIDATPPVVTGPESGVEITHRATEEEQQQVLEEQQAVTEGQEKLADVVFEPAPSFEAAVEEEDEEQKGFDAPPRDKAVKRSPKQK